MTVKRCDMCFQDKPQLVPVLEGVPARVCKACSYKVNQVTGFLEYHGIQLTYQPRLVLDTPPAPPGSGNGSKSKSSRRKPTHVT